jgi:hypothetical protein
MRNTGPPTPRESVCARPPASASPARRFVSTHQSGRSTPALISTAGSFGRCVVTSIVRLPRGCPYVSRRGGRAQLRPAAIVALAFLDRRTWHRPVGAKHTAIALLRLEQRLASGAFVEVLARVGRHGLDLGGTALRTSQRRLENDVHIGGSIQKVSTSNPTARTRAILLPQSNIGLAHAVPGAHNRVLRCRAMMKALAPRQIAAA